MKALVSILLLVVVFTSDHQVSGSCSNVVADTDWASCLKGDSCPLGFIKTDDDMECGPQKVCCLMRPTFDLNVVDAPCIIEGVSGQDDSAKHRYKKHS